MTDHQRLFGVGLTISIVEHLEKGPMTVLQLVDAMCIQTSIEDGKMRAYLYRRILRQLHSLKSIDRLEMIELKTGRKTKKYKICLKK